MLFTGNLLFCARENLLAQLSFLMYINTCLILLPPAVLIKVINSAWLRRGALQTLKFVLYPLLWWLLRKKKKSLKKAQIFFPHFCTLEVAFQTQTSVWCGQAVAVRTHVTCSVQPQGQGHLGLWVTDNCYVTGNWCPFAYWKHHRVWKRKRWHWGDSSSNSH